jgi:hypothetical protein
MIIAYLYFQLAKICMPSLTSFSTRHYTVIDLVGHVSVAIQSFTMILTPCVNCAPPPPPSMYGIQYLNSYRQTPEFRHPFLNICENEASLQFTSASVEVTSTLPNSDTQKDLLMKLLSFSYA